MVDRSKALVTRSALERVLARAAELQSKSGDESEPDSLTEAQVEELAKEVGLSAQHIRQALAEERVRIELAPVEGSGASPLFGTEVLESQRVVRGRPERVLATLDRWMQKEEGLKVKRQRSDVIAWEPMRGVFGSLRRMLGAGDFALTRAEEVSATVVAMDDEFTLVRVQACFRVLRAGMRNRFAFGTAFGVAVSGAAAGVLFIIPLSVPLFALLPFTAVPALLAGAGSYHLAREAYQNALQRAHLALEQVLDRMERGDVERPSLLRMIESALPPSR
jgi:hypothetical protein